MNLPPLDLDALEVSSCDCWADAGTTHCACQAVEATRKLVAEVRHLRAAQRRSDLVVLKEMLTRARGGRV